MLWKDIIEFEEDPNFTISNITARQVLDSRGNPTIEVEVVTEGGGVGVAIAPAGLSRGKFEAVELRDGDEKFYRGKSVLNAVKNVNELIAPEIIGLDARDQRRIDETLIKIDGTPNKSRLGANAILAVSIATAKAAADTYSIPLYKYLGGVRANIIPTPMLNIINGGLHAGNELSIQEFMIVPVRFKTFSDAIRAACEIYYSLKDVLKEKYGLSALNVGDEGGFSPPMRETREALEAIVKAVELAGYSAGKEVLIALDVAASTLYENGKYKVDGKEMDSSTLLEFYEDLVNTYPIISIEDPFHEEDFKSFKILMDTLGKKVLIVGDDLFVTNIDRLRKGVEEEVANGIIIKMNQVGTLTETMEVIEYAQHNGFQPIVSHRSGESEDYTIADLAVAFNVGLIKTGAPARGERTTKYNRLLRIEENLGRHARFAGELPFKNILKWR